MDMHLVGAKRGPALAKARKIERARVALAGADVQHVTLARLIPMHQQIADLGQRRACDQTVDDVPIAAPGGALPKVLRGPRLGKAGRRRLGRRNPTRNAGEIYDVSGHSDHPEAKPTQRQGLRSVSSRNVAIAV